jgi:hypothetical protein
MSTRIARAALVMAGVFMLVLTLFFGYLAFVSSAQESPLERGPNILSPALLGRVSLVCAAAAGVCFWFARAVKRLSGGDEPDKRK